MEKVISDISDPNNNSSLTVVSISNSNSKSYSLRPRASVRSGLNIVDDDNTSEWRPRGRTKRRSKQKPPPLSKYRRKTANARERSRMREINDAFESLRKAIPHLSQETSHNEKMTKITTLRLAMKYISALNQVLQDPDQESDLDSAEYTLSLTPTSLSDTSDFYDQFLSSDTMSVSSATNYNPLRTETVSSNISEFLQSPCYSLTPPDNSATLIDIRDHCLTPSDFHTDFDGLASPPVDFEDLFAT